MKKQNRQLKYLKEEETAELFVIIKNDKCRHTARNQAIFYLAKYCALRVSEVGMLRMQYYNDWRMEIYCEREKGSLSNTLRIIDPETISYLKEYLAVRPFQYPASDRLFPSQKGNPISRQQLDRIMKYYCKKTSIPEEKHHFHVLKHTRAIELGNIGLDIKEIQWWLGHKNINNTLIYLQFTTTQQEILYEKLAKRGKKNEEDKTKCYF